LLDRSVSYIHDFMFVTVTQFEKCWQIVGGQYEVKVLNVRKLAQPQTVGVRPNIAILCTYT
jgi:hypothetical protein